VDSRHRKLPQRLPRRDLLKAGVAAGAMLSAEPVLGPRMGWAQQPKRGGTLRAWGYDPPHFDPHLILGGKTHNTLSFVYSRLLRHKVGAGVPPGTFTIEPDLAERWERRFLLCRHHGILAALREKLRAEPELRLRRPRRRALARPVDGGANMAPHTPNARGASAKP
jgi:hypothetical protein